MSSNEKNVSAPHDGHSWDDDSTDAIAVPKSASAPSVAKPDDKEAAAKKAAVESGRDHCH